MASIRSGRASCLSGYTHWPRSLFAFTVAVAVAVAVTVAVAAAV